MRAPAVSSISKIVAAAFAALLIFALVPTDAFAEGEGASESGVEAVASGLSDQSNDFADSVILSEDNEAASPSVTLSGASGGGEVEGSNTKPLTLASGVVGKPSNFINSDVAFDGEPVIGSFIVDGLTFAVIDESNVELVGVASSVTLSEAAEGGVVEGSNSNQASEAGLASLALPESVTYEGVSYTLASIAPYAFYLSGMTSVMLPASVNDVDDRAFRSSDVASVQIAEGNPFYSSFDGALYDASQSSLLLIPEGKQGAVLLPKTAEVAEASVFSHCPLVDSISVEKDGAAFASENGLLYTSDLTTLLRVPAGATEITIRDGCTTIAAGALEACAKLTTINAPASATSISPYALSREPVTVAPVASVVAEPSTAETGSIDAGERQISTMVALTAVDRALPVVDTSRIVLNLGGGAIALPWQCIGFTIEETAGSEEVGASLVAQSEGMSLSADMQSASTNRASGGFPCVLVYLAPGYNLKYKVDAWNIHPGIDYATWDQASINMDPNVSPNQGIPFIGLQPSSGYAWTRYTDDGTNNFVTSYHVLLDGRGAWNPIQSIRFLQLSSAGAYSSYKITLQEATEALNQGLIGPNGGWGFSFPGDGSIAKIFAYYDEYYPNIRFDANGGEIDEVGTKDIKVDDLNLLTTPTPTRAGYDFQGWYTEASDGTKVCDANKSQRFFYDTTLYAHWTKKASYTVTFEKNGGIGGTSSAYYWPDNGYTSSETSTTIKKITAPTLTGWSFKGYTDNFGTNSYLYVKSDGSATTRQVTSNDRKLYANWAKTVTLDANGGTAGSLKSLTAGIGRPLGQKCTQVKEDHSDYPIRSLFKKGITDDEDWAPTRTGYTFGGYYDTAESTGGTCYINAAGKAQGKVDSAIPSTLYARWTANDITLTWSLEYQIGTPPLAYWSDGDINDRDERTTSAQYSSTAIIGTALQTVEPRHSLAGTDKLQFMGWYTAPSSSTATLHGSEGRVDENTPLPSSDTTYYARFTDKVDVFWDANGGSWPGNATKQSEKKLSQEEYNAYGTPPSRPGYSFEGWATSRTGTAVKFPRSLSSREAASETLYAIWSEKPIMLTWSFAYYVGGPTNLATWGTPGDSNPRTTTKAYAADAVLGDAYQKTRPVHILGDEVVAFDGWYVTPDGGTDATHDPALKVSENTPLPAQDTTYYARWRGVKQVTWDANGGSWDDGATQQQAGVPFGDMTDRYDIAPKRNGYFFDGWSATKDGELASFPIEIRTNTTYYARWKSVVSADAPMDATVRVDLLGIEDQAMEPGKEGYIESRSGAPLKVESVAFTREAGAEQLFGSSFGQVSLQALAGDDASWATGTPAFSFALDAAGADAVEDDEARLAPFAMSGYEERIPISYRFAIPSDVLAAIDPARFEQVTTSVCSVVYTVALQNPPQGPSA